MDERIYHSGILVSVSGLLGKEEPKRYSGTKLPCIERFP